jgi:phosphatidylserine/phosphatidylglycerophosphate/cardiolipin synthase-like enzyme
VTAIRAYANCDRAQVVWQLDARVPNCRGFALYRREGGTGEGEALPTWVGFGDQQAPPPGTMRPSTEWPIQKFMWSDFDAPSDTAVSYRVVPMVGKEGNLQPAEEHATDWSNEVVASAAAGTGYSAYFNRGILATQWIARKLREMKPGHQIGSLKKAIATPGDPIRTFLAGAVLPELPSLLEGAETIYAALYELNDPELLAALEKLGPKANVVLANGADTGPGEDENCLAREFLKKANVTVHDRLVRGYHFAHNKFLVLCDANGAPHAVWTGSTNWTTTGLCTQANNALLIEDAATAQFYLDEWHAIAEAGDDYPDELLESNDQERKTHVGGAAEQVFFTPDGNFKDLQRATDLINGAQHGILFLMFNPGPSGTLLNAILERSATSSVHYDPTLYIHGVLNQDPSTTKHPVGLFHRGQFELAQDDIVLPSKIAEDFGFWLAELQKLPETHAMVHSKTIVVDPFGDHPIVMTGSHNMGPKASSQNDDNLVIVENAPELAAAYAVNIMGVYDNYRWRFRRSGGGQPAAGGTQPAAGGTQPVAPSAAGGTQPVAPPQPGAAPAAAPAPPAHTGWHGLQDNDTWQDDYFKGAKARELRFWLGQPEPAPPAPPAPPA